MSVPHRLPPAVRPRLYAVEIEADPAWATFQGAVRIELDVVMAVDTVEMHARGLELSEATIDGVPVSIELRPETETVVFTGGSRQEVGRRVLKVAFRGRPNEGMHGLYLARDDEEVALATQCEATDCRAIFPCFDEPAFKAAIQWTVRTSASMTALANGRLLEVEDGDDGTKVWRFAATEPVSSYLAALTIGRYEALPPSSSNGTPLQVWALSGKQDQTQFARAFTERLFPWYEAYFGLPYAYGKYDQVAVPGFDAGAMENVGLVLFRQNLLLMDPGSTSWNQEKLIAKVIAHELAHMWFGNLVTMSWWDDLWLNEAFAEWFAHKATDAVAGHYQVWNDFQLDKNRALTDDAMDTTHAVWAPVDTPSQALEMFDVITYQKGCAVMRMLECFLGDTAFRAGIRTYMRAFSGRNATGDDLWRHLEHASKQPVGALMRSWVEQPGFPLITVRRRSSSVVLTQQRFSSRPPAGASSQLWNVPVGLRYEDDEGVKVFRGLLSKREEELTIPAVGDIKWVYGNADEVGFYRVYHADGALDGLPVSALTAPEQMGLLEDHWSLVRNGTLDVVDFVPLVDRFAGSTDHNVLRALSERLWTLERLIEDHGDTAATDGFRRRLREGFGPHLERLGFAPDEGEGQDRTQCRAVVLQVLGALAEDPRVIEEARRRAADERRDARSVDANLAGTYLSVAARHGDSGLYDEWMSTYRNRRAAGAPPQESLRYLYTLAAFREPALVDRTLAALADGTIPQEAIGGLLSQLLSARHGRLPAWQFLKQQWSALRPRIGDMGISRVVESVGRLPASERADVERFFETTHPEGAERALARALAAMDEYEGLRSRATPALVRMMAESR